MLAQHTGRAARKGGAASVTVVAGAIQADISAAKKEGIAFRAPFAVQEIRDGVRQKWEYRVKFFGEDETTAKSMIEEEEPDPFGFSQDGDD